MLRRREASAALNHDLVIPACRAQASAPAGRLSEGSAMESGSEGPHERRSFERGRSLALWGCFAYARASPWPLGLPLNMTALVVRACAAQEAKSVIVSEAKDPPNAREQPFQQHLIILTTKTTPIGTPKPKSL